MLRFNDIADRMLEYNPGVDLELLQRAYIFSAKVHEGQERLSGEPYLIHPLEVAGLLVKMRLDDVAVAAGLLHDTLEDTLTTREELERHFGEQVAFLVDGLTKIAKIEFSSAKQRQAENFRKMLIAMSKDIRILLIKLADRLHNMRTLGYMRDDARRRIAMETQEIYVPLAHRLGIQWMKQELQDLAFRALKPGVAEELERGLDNTLAEREKCIGEVRGILTAKLAEAGIDAEISGRTKDLASVHAKMESQGLTLDQIYDVIAFRIVVDGSTESCYAALGVVHTTWRPVTPRFKDYIALPKPNGYRSLHTTVIGPHGERMEVQIRTKEMHRDAELGIAAHWKYKAGRIDTDDDDSTFAWLRQLLEWQSELEDPHEFLDAVKVDLFPNEVFVFTPRGEVIELPQRASPVDFAYAIHSEIGDHCAGAKVNGKMVPLRSHLADGDTVEIVTNANQFPRKDWLEFVTSGKAKNRIRHFIRAASKDRSRQLGRDMLTRQFRRAGLSLARLEESGAIDELASSEIRGGKPDDLFSAVAFGKLHASALIKKLRGEEDAPSEAEPKVQRFRQLFRRQKRGASDSGIRVNGQPDVLVRFGGCCGPLPGDEIVGFVTRGRGVTVHSTDCQRVYELEPERKIEVSWDSDPAVVHKIKIRVSSKDQPGILAKITNSISDAGVNIGAANISTQPGQRAVQSFELWVTDVSILNRVMKEIERVKGVVSVERVRG